MMGRIFSPTALASTLVLFCSLPCTHADASRCSIGEWHDEKAGGCATCPVERWCKNSSTKNNGDMTTMCRLGHTGHACSNCDNDFFYSSFKSVCRECPSQIQAILSWVGTSLIFILILAFIYRSSAEAFDVGAFTIVTTHFCLVYVFFKFDVYVPGAVERAALPLSVLTGFVFDVLGEFAGVSCMGWGDDYTFWWTTKTLAPLILCVPFVIQSIVIHFQQQADHEADSAKLAADRILSIGEYTMRKERSKRNKQSVQTVLFVVLTAVMFIVEASVTVWTCEKFDDGKMRLSANPSIECSWDDDTYRPLLVASVAIFTIYFAGLTLFLVLIIESPMGRLSAADHNVTHAKILRDATLRSQISFFFALIIHGPEYGRVAERERLKSRLQTHFRIALAVRRLQVQVEKGIRDEEFERDLAIVQEKLHRFKRSRRPIPKPREEHFTSAFPVFVPLQDKPNMWIRGVFNGFDDEGHPRVATGSGEEVRCVSYEQARVHFENGRPVNVRDDLSSWHQQDGDPVNAMSGAPLGVVGTVDMAETYQSFEDDANAATDIVDFVDIALPSTATFTFYLDLTKNMGFVFHQRSGKVLVKAVVPGGQGNIAGLTEKCVIRRVGGTTVRTPEEFEVAVIKRRIVSAQLRKHMLETEEPATPLSEEDEVLLANNEIVELVSRPETINLTKELTKKIEECGLDTHCTVTFTDPSFTITRRLPTDFTEFRKIAELKPFDEYWSTYGSIISAYKSSTRHFEHWANIRKLLAVVAEVYLLSRGPVAQISTMLAVCGVALMIQLRLSPYDDLNTHNPSNSADAMISNNNLESILLVLQIAQLFVSLTSLYVGMPDLLIIILYIGILLLALIFSLIALSTSVAKAAHSALQVCEPYISATQQYFGVSLLFKASNDNSAVLDERERRLSHSSRRQSRTSLDLLKVAREYETAKIEEATIKMSGKFGPMTTLAAKHRLQARMSEEEQRKLADQSLALAKSAWLERHQAAKKRGSKLNTKTEDVGRLGTETVASRASIDSLKEKQKSNKAQDKSLQLQKEKEAYETRRAKEAEQGTVPQDRGRLALKTRSSSMREEALQEFKQQKHAKEGALAVQKAAWQRRQDQQGGKTHSDDIGALGRQTEAALRRKSAREADEADKIAKALQEEAEKKAQNELWQRRMSNRSKSRAGGNTGLAFQMKTGSSSKRSNTSQSTGGWGGGASGEIGLVRRLSGNSMDSFESSMDSDDNLSLAQEVVTSPPTNLDLEGIPEVASENGSSGVVQLSPGAEMV